MRLRFFILVMALTASVGSSSTASAEMPKHVREGLNKLVGVWSMEFTVNQQKIEREVHIDWSPSEAVLTYSWTEAMPDGARKSGFGTFGWDLAKKSVLEQSFDDQGSVFTARHYIPKDGDWVSPATGTEVIGGEAKPHESFRIFKIESSDEWHVVMQRQFKDGEPQPDSVAIFRKKQNH